MTRLVKYVDTILCWLLICLTAVMVFDVSWQVFTRFVLKNPSSFTEELATFLLIWISLLGSAYALRRKAHLGIDIITIRMKPQTQYVWEFFVYSVVILFSILVLIWGGSRLVIITLHLNQISAALRVKMGYVYSVIPLTGLLMVFYSLYFMCDAWHRLKTHHFNKSEHTSIQVDL